MAIQKAKAYVLKRKPLRESSLLITVFSDSFGKIKLLAKGVRKEKKPALAALEPFTCVSIVYYEKLRSDIHLLSEVSIFESQRHLRCQLDHFANASYMTELLDQLFEVYDPHPDVFELLADAFQLMHRARPSLVRLIFEIKLFKALGWLPVLSDCVNCGLKNPGQVFFSPRLGGILCSNCEHEHTQTIPMAKEVIECFRIYSQEAIGSAIKLGIRLKTEELLEHVANRFLSYRLEYPLRSSYFLSEIST